MTGALDFEDLQLRLIVTLDLTAKALGPRVVVLHRGEVVTVSIDDQQSRARVSEQCLEGGGVVGAAKCGKPGTRTKRVRQKDVGYPDVQRFGKRKEGRDERAIGISLKD